MEVFDKKLKLFKAQVSINKVNFEQAGKSFSYYLSDVIPLGCDSHTVLDKVKDLKELFDITGLNIIFDKRKNMTGFESKYNKGLHHWLNPMRVIGFFDSEYMGNWVEGNAQIEVGEEKSSRERYRVTLVNYQDDEVTIEEYYKPLERNIDTEEIILHPRILAHRDERLSEDKIKEEATKKFRIIRALLDEKKFNEVREIKNSLDPYVIDNNGQNLLAVCIDSNLDAIKFLIEDTGLDPNKPSVVGGFLKIYPLYHLVSNFEPTPELKEIYAYLISIGARGSNKEFKKKWK